MCVLAHLFQVLQVGHVACAASGRCSAQRGTSEVPDAHFDVTAMNALRFLGEIDSCTGSYCDGSGMERDAPSVSLKSMSCSPSMYRSRRVVFPVCESPTMPTCAVPGGQLSASCGRTLIQKAWFRPRSANWPLIVALGRHWVVQA